MGAVFGDRFLLLGFVAPNSPNFFTKNAFNSIRELFFPREGSMSHEKNGCSTKATHGATTEWDQCLEICFYVLDLWPRIPPIFSQKMHLIRYESYFSHARVRCPTKRICAAQRQHMIPPPNGSSFWRSVFTACICGPEFSEIFSQKMHLIRYESYFSPARVRCPTKRMGAGQRQPMTPPPNGSSFWR